MVETSPTSSSYPETSLLPVTNSMWRNYGYYVAGVYDVTSGSRVVTVGDDRRSSRDGVQYVSTSFEDGQSVYFFIRVYSAVEEPVSE